MPTENHSTHKMRPYARLLTMLGDQLIKDELIALSELIKNGYDADAEEVSVHFINFTIDVDEQSNEYIKTQNDSKIIIRDSGTGMTDDVITKHWLNPATPIKKHLKKEHPKTKKGREIQGEKGIGRFSLFKLGGKIELTTRPINSINEYELLYNFHEFNNDFSFKKKMEDGKEEESYLFLDDIQVTLIERSEDYKIAIEKDQIWKRNHGTQITIENLKGNWTYEKIKEIYKDVRKLKPIFEDLRKDEGKNKKYNGDFIINFYINKQKESIADKEYIETLNSLMNDRAVLKITDGTFDCEKTEFKFNLNKNQYTLNLNSPEISGLSVFKKLTKERQKDLHWDTGSFAFQFFIFDFSASAPTKFVLDRTEKDIIKENRVYLYRDNIRVYPYGEKNDDWLGIDIYRGTVSAGGLLSNDQIVGCVNISQKNNPNLIDKTSREGLIGNQASDDLIILLKIFLSYIRLHPYAQYKENNNLKESHNIFKGDIVEKYFDEIKTVVKGNKKAEEVIEETKKTYKKEKEYLIRRVEVTEALAGVGLSVETASHDIMLFMNKAIERLDTLISSSIDMPINSSELETELNTIRGAFSFVQDRLKNIQALFKSSKQRRKAIRVKDSLDKIIFLFNKIINSKKIILNITTIGSPVVIKAIDAVLMQVFINLLDNSIYWLSTLSKEKKEINIVLNGDSNTMIFSDNGPGINMDDEKYIFEAFYSGKGDDGRGLGLYIARQLLERYEFSIDLVAKGKDKKLSGANFIIDFNISEE